MKLKSVHYFEVSNKDNENMFLCLIKTVIITSQLIAKQRKFLSRQS